MGGLGVTLPSKTQQIVRSTAFAKALEFLDEIEPGLGILVPEIEGRSQSLQLSDMWIKKREQVLERINEEARTRFADNSSLLGSKWLHAMPRDKRSRLSDGSFCGGIADRLLLTDISGKHTSHQIFRHEELKRLFKTSLEQAGCTVANEPHQNDGVSRGDLHIRGGVIGGNIIADLTVVLCSGVPAKAVSPENSTSELDLKKCYDEIEKALERRYLSKVRKYRGKDFDAPVIQWVLSAGGNLHVGMEKMIETLKKVDRRIHAELTWSISFILMQYRARVGLNRLLDI